MEKKVYTVIMAPMPSWVWDEARNAFDKFSGFDLDKGFACVALFWEAVVYPWTIKADVFAFECRPCVSTLSNALAPVYKLANGDRCKILIHNDLKFFRYALISGLRKNLSRYGSKDCV